MNNEIQHNEIKHNGSIEGCFAATLFIIVVFLVTNINSSATDILQRQEIKQSIDRNINRDIEQDVERDIERDIEREIMHEHSY